MAGENPSGDITIEAVLAHPPETVWKALTTPEMIADWLKPNDFAPEKGKRFTLRTEPMGNWDGVIQCEVLEIEVSVVKGRGKVQLTGTLGDVMKESASAALSYARARARALGIESEFYRTKDIHIHMPAGATPKDGPSAGIAIATAVISALTGVPVRGDVAMTGEITLRGRVLPIGGLKEKSVAAHRNKVTDVIVPNGNARDIEELPEEVRASVRFHPVKTMDEVLALALRPQPAATAS